jgi:hypothetical protein
VPFGQPLRLGVEVIGELDLSPRHHVEYTSTSI